MPARAKSAAAVPTQLSLKGGVKKTSGQNKLERELDQFFTRPDIARECLQHVAEKVAPLDSFETVLEPSVGSGAFWDLLPEANRVGVDLDPKRAEFVRGDFLALALALPVVAVDGTGKAISANTKKVLVVGNPPYGKNGSLALKFLNRALEIGDTVAFILPMSFKLASVQNKICRRAHLLFEKDVPKNAFVFSGSVHDVPSVFQIWQLGTTVRDAVDMAQTHSDFEFLPAKIVSASVPGVVILRRAGGSAGKVLATYAGECLGNLMFIKSANPVRMRQRLVDLDLANDPVLKHRTWQKSISRSDVVRRYSESYD